MSTVVVPAVVAALAAAAALLWLDGSGEVLGVVAVLSGVAAHARRRLRQPRPGPPPAGPLWRRGRHPAPGPPLPPGLVRLERLVGFATGSGFDAHYRLRPLLRRLAAARLAGRGVDRDADPDAARALLGDDAWAFLRADRPAPADRAGGADVAALEATVAAVERLGRA